MQAERAHGFYAVWAAVPKAGGSVYMQLPSIMPLIVAHNAHGLLIHVHVHVFIFCPLQALHSMQLPTQTSLACTAQAVMHSLDL